jgi:hypothetical protein
MRYKREEAFRFQFEKDISAHFSIAEVNGIAVNTHEGDARLVDLSPNGIKLESDLDIPIKGDDQVKISVRFNINESEFILGGKLIWVKKIENGFFYGIQLDVEENLHVEIIKELKDFSKAITN